MNTSSLRYKTVAGIIWTSFQQFFKVGIQTINTLVLAWFLLPADFGLMAMISVFFAIAQSLTDFGFSEALIQKKEVNQTDYSTAFYLNLVIGLLAYALLFALAHSIASFYNEPRLIVLVRIVGLVVIINSFQLVQVADLTRKLNFKAQFKITLFSALFSSVVAISMAAMGFGVWSLVAQMLASTLASTALYWIFNKWRPSKNFSVKSLNEMFGFGSKLLVSGLIDTAFQNIYVIVIGKLFLATLVGYYFFAQRIEMLVITQLSNAVQRVTYPILSAIQDDNSTLKRIYRKSIQVSNYIIIPCLIALVVLAKPLFSLLLNEKWLPAVPYLQLLCMEGLLYPLHVINLNILKVKGRSDLFLYLEVVKKLMAVIIIFFSVRFGIFGILIGQIVISVLSYIPNSYFSIKLIDYSLSEQLQDVIPTLLLAITMGVFMYAAGSLLPLGNFGYISVIGFSGAIFYILTNHLLKTPAQLLLFQIIEEQYLKRRNYSAWAKQHQ